MQFTKELAEKILREEKTQTRRTGPPRHKVGSRQPIQNGYRKGCVKGYVVIDKVRKQCVDQITDKEIKAEGFANYKDWLEVMRNSTRGRFQLTFHANLELTVYEFHLDKEQ